jgi:tripartite-type tricarboxylate transporter receptor subunit TctC
VNEALLMPEVKAQLALQGFPGKGSTPAELGEFMKDQRQSWAAATRAAGIQPE